MTPAIIYVLFLFLTFFNCSKSNTPEDFFVTILTEGTWKVSNYVHYEIDDSTNFIDYIIDFKTNGTLTVTKGNETINGDWHITHGNYITFIKLNFLNSEVFQPLNKTWSYRLNSPDEIKVVDNLITNETLSLSKL